MHLLGFLGAVGVPLLTGALAAYRRFRLTRTNEIESFSRYVTRGVKYYVGRRLRHRLAAELTLRQYARIHLLNTATEMLVPATYPVGLRVDDVFVPLLLRDPRGGTTEHTELVEAASERIVILGEPGSGKSSLMKRTFRDACRRANADPRRAAMPLLFELGKLARLKEAELTELSHERLFSLCVRSLDDSATFKSADAVDDLRHGAGYLVLLDGLDEVPSHAAAHVAATIVELAEHLSLSSPRSTLIVSTRTQHYLAMRDRAFAETFQALSIRPFSVGDVYEFLKRWPFDADRLSQISRLFSRIRLLPSLTEMCTNPLALAMYVARDQQTEGALSPETRTEFYRELVDELLVNRRLRSEESTGGRQRLRQQREQILGAACLDHLLDPDEARNSVPEQRLLDRIAAAGHARDAAPGMLERLAIETGLFSVERQGETYTFLHLTLCEFLAAREIVNRGSGGWHEIARRLTGAGGASVDDQWASRLGEVVAFACGLAPRALRDAILADLARLGDRGLLLRAAIEAQGYADARVRTTIEMERDDLAATPAARWDVLWFARLRLLLSVLRDVNAGARSELGAGAVEDMPTPADYLMSLIERYGAEDRLLTTLARHDAHGAIAIAEASRSSALMDVVAASADDDGLLLGILARCEAGRREWKQALVHSALHGRHIATTLAGSTEGLRTEAAPAWGRSYLLRGSVYGTLLDDVLADRSGWRAADVPLLEALRDIAPPRSELRAALRASAVLGLRSSGWAGVVLTLLTGAVTLAAATSVFRTDVQQLNDLLQASLFVLVVALVTMLLGVGGVLYHLLREGLVDPDAMRTRRGRPSEASAGGDTSAAEPVTFWRGAVLEEVVGLRRCRFAAADVRDDDGRRQWRPSTFERLVGGVPARDVRALIAARELRVHDALRPRRGTESSLRLFPQSPPAARPPTRGRAPAPPSPPRAARPRRMRRRGGLR